MDCKITSIEDIDRLKHELARLRAGGKPSLYRGQSDWDWKIVSSLKRVQKQDSDEELWKKYILSFEELASQLKSLDVEAFKTKTENANFYLLSIARHLGFPCNLIDWTASLDMAIYTACCSNTDKDGSLYILLGELKINLTPTMLNPLTINESIIVCKDFDNLPSGYSSGDLPLARMRRFRQNGFFSIISQHDLSNNFELLLPNHIILHKIQIPANLKHEIIHYMNLKGISNNWFLLGNNLKDQSSNIINEIKNKYY